MWKVLSLCTFTVPEIFSKVKLGLWRYLIEIMIAL